MMPRTPARVGLLALLAVAVAAGPAPAQSAAWGVDAAGNWSGAANWSPATPPVAGGTATFAFPITANRTVTLDVNATLDALAFVNTASSGGYTINATGANALTVNAAGTLSFGSAAVNNLAAPITMTNGLTATGRTNGQQLVSGIISGAGQLVVNSTVAHIDSGSLTLGGANTFAGGVRLQGGVLRTNNNAALGTGTLFAAGGVLQVGTGTILGNAIDLTDAGLTVTSTGGGLTLNGAVSGANGLTVSMRGNQTVTLTGVNTYAGPTVVRPIPVDVSNGPSLAGGVILSGNGTALNTSRLDAISGTIRLNSGGQPTANSRVAAGVPVNLTNGVFQVTGGTDTGTSFTQTVGPLTGSGYGVVVAESAAVGAQGTEIAFASLNRGTSGTFLFTGSTNNFGTAALAPGVQRITFAAAPTPVGGALGTASAAVLPYAVGGLAANSTGIGLVTYDANGVRLLADAEYATDTLTAGTNYRQATAQTNNANVTLNSALITAGNLSGTGTLTVTSGAVAFTNAATVTNNLSFGAAQANVFTLGGSAVVTGRISGTGGLVKSGGSSSAGAGANGLTLSAYNTYTGPTVVNDGFLQFVDASALGRDTTAVQLVSRSTTTGAGLRVDPSAAAAGIVVPFGRPIVTTGGYSNLSGATGGTNPRAVFAATGAISGDGGVMVSGTSTLVTRSLTYLSGANTYTGATRLFAGDLGVGANANLGAASAPLDLGTLTGAGLVQFGDLTMSRVVNISSASQWDTNGFAATLSGPLTGTSNLTKAGAGTLTLDNLGASTYAGSLTLAGGGLTLAGTTQLPLLSNAQVNLLSGTLRFDNTGTAVNNRLGAQSAVRFQNAGDGLFQIDAGTNSVSQTLSALSLGVGGTASSRVRLTAGAGGTARLNVTGATGYGVSGNNSPSFVLAGEGLVNTATATLPGQTAVLFSTAPTEANGQWAGTGAAGTPTVGIYRGGFGVRLVGGATDAVGFLTQTSTTVGARLLDEATEYAVNPGSIAAATNANVLATANVSFVDTVTMNSLYLRGGSTVTLAAANTSTVRSGSILTTTGDNLLQGSGPNGGGAILGTPAINAIQSGVVVYTLPGSSLTLRATLSGGGPGARLVKLGGGRLVFDPRDGTGAAASFGANVTDTRLFDGTLAVPAGQSIANLPGTIFLAGGAGSVLENRGANLQTTKVFNLNGAGGTLDLGTTAVQLTGTGDTLTRQVAGNNGVLRLSSGTLILGSGSAGTPAATQNNTFEGGLQLNGGTLVLNADSNFATGSVLGTGTLRLNGGVLAPKFATRNVAVPVEVAAGVNPTFVNNTADFAADATNSGLTFLAPVRLEGAATTITNGMTGTTGGLGLLTFQGSLSDNPFRPAAAVSFSAGATNGQFVLAGPATYRGGTTVLTGAVVRAANTVGSATGPGNLTVNSGGELRGGNPGGTAGFVVPAAGGTVTVNGTLAPGNGVTAPGILTVGAPDRSVNLAVLGAGSRYVFNLAATNPGSATPLTDGSSTTAVGTGNNFLRALGLVGAGSTLNVSPATFAVASNGTLTNFDPTLYYSWQVASLTDGTAVAGTVTAGTAAFDTTAFNNAAPLPGNSFFQLAVSGPNVLLNYSPVPEPAAGLAVAAAGVAVLRRRRVI